MTVELNQSKEKLKAAADISSALARQIAELLELQEAVRKAELPAECNKQNCKQQIVRPGRLFMQTQWLMRRSYPSA
jgi:hypothetical protein